MTGAAEMLPDTWQFPENSALDANLIKAGWKNLCSNSVFGCELSATPNMSAFCFHCVLDANTALWVFKKILALLAKRITEK